MEGTNLSPQTNCRACLQKQLQSQMYSLASKNMPIEENINQSNVEMVNLSEIYNQCTQLIYEQMNPNWEWICQDCVGKLMEFFKFRKMCIESYDKLKKIDVLSVERLENSEFEIKIEVVDEDVANIFESHNDNVSSDDEYFDNEQSSTSLKWDDETELDSENKHGAADRRQYGIRRRCGTVKIENISELPNEHEEAHQSVNTGDSCSNESMHVCDICSKKFVKKHRYDAHRRIHLGPKQWKCEHCEKAFGKFSTFALNELNEEKLKCVGDFLNDEHKEFKNQLNCCYSEYYSQIVKFLLGHKEHMLALPIEIKRFMDNIKKQHMHGNSCVSDDIGDGRDDEQFKVKLLKSLMASSDKFGKQYGFELPNDLITEANIIDFQRSSNRNLEYKCRFQCPFCPKTIPIIYKKYWWTSNFTKHLKQHLQPFPQVNVELDVED